MGEGRDCQQKMLRSIYLANNIPVLVNRGKFESMRENTGFWLEQIRGCLTSIVNWKEYEEEEIDDNFIIFFNLIEI